MFRKLFVLATLLLTGCGVPMERTSTLDQRENVAQKATSEFATSVAPTPMEVEVKGKDGSTTTVRQPVASTTSGSATAGENSDSAGWFNSSATVPLFVKIIGIAVGLAMLAGAVVLIVKVLKQSAAIKAAWAYADTSMSDLIHSIRTHQTTATDPAAINALKVAEAEAERRRAEMNKD